MHDMPLLLIVSVIFFTSGCAGTITSIAKGSKNPETNPKSEIVNVDFLIPDSTNNLVGDGKDENTYWLFDFRNDWNYWSFKRKCNVADAIIHLTLKPTAPDYSSDTIRIAGLYDAGNDILKKMKPDGTFQQVKINLIGYPGYDKGLDSSIRKAILADPSGRLWMRYSDDALISHASLEISCDNRKE